MFVRLRHFKSATNLYTGSMHTNIPQSYFLVALLAIAAALSFFVFRPFITVLVLAMIFAVVLQPLYRGVTRWSRDRFPGFAAFATILITAVCILMPLSFIAVHIADDAERLYDSLVDGTAGTYLDTLFVYVDEATAQYAPGLSVSAIELSASIDQYMKNGLIWLAQNLGGVFSSAAQFLLYLFIFLIALYYLLRDGAKLRQSFISISPLTQSDDDIVLNRLERAINSVIRGSLTVALIQGVLTSIGFTFFGVPHPVLWGVAAALSALIPGVGTSLVLIPGVAYLFIIGAAGAAAGLLLWSVLAVGLVDNLLGPRLVGKGMELHPLLVLLAVFGGLAFFGPAGIFLGPLSISLLFALFSIYPNISK